MKYNNATPQVRYKTVSLDEEKGEPPEYSETNADTYNSKRKRFSNIYEKDIAEQFKSMQNSIMQEEIPVLARLLDETTFDSGYESTAERYFSELSDKYGVIADTVLQNIYLQNMYNKEHLLKHLLFIVANLPINRRNNLEIIPLAGISNPDTEIQDLSVKCFEAWEDKRHIPTLISLRDRTNISWFKDYVNGVIEELNGEQ